MNKYLKYVCCVFTGGVLADFLCVMGYKTVGIV